MVQTDDPASVVAPLLRSQLQPSALDVLHPGRVAVLFEGSERAVAAQVDAARLLVGGDEQGPEVWAESRERQGLARQRLRFDPGSLAETLSDLGEAVVRPGAGVAYPRTVLPSYNLSQGSPDAVERLVARIKSELDPRGTLA